MTGTGEVNREDIVIIAEKQQGFISSCQSDPRRVLMNSKEQAVYDVIGCFTVRAIALCEAR